MKLVETKIYLRFILWFIAVSVSSLAVFFVIVKIINQDAFFINRETQKAITIGIFTSTAYTLLISLIATHYLSKFITNPIKRVVKQLSRIVTYLIKSINNISQTSQKNQKVSNFLLDASNGQSTNAKEGNIAVKEMLDSLNKITIKLTATTKDTTKINRLTQKSNEKAKIAMSNMSVIKQLSTKNQKLNFTLEEYTNQVDDIAKNMGNMSEKLVS